MIAAQSGLEVVFQPLAKEFHPFKALVKCVLISLIFVLLSHTGKSQCGYFGINYGDVTPAAVGSVVELWNVWGGDQYTLQAQAGCTYTVSTCGGSFDSQITVFNESATSIAYNDDFCGFQSQVTFTAATTGAYTIQINEYWCLPNFTDSYMSVTLDSCAGGCGDVAACNYTAGGTDNTQCCYDNCVTIEMFDSWGDSWNGASYSFTDDGGVVVATGTLDVGATEVETLCLPDGCYDFYVGGGSFDSEISWNLTGVVGAPISGTAPQLLGVGVNTTEDCTIESDAIIVDGSTFSAEELISDVFLGDCLEASNIVFAGDPNAIGTFSNGASIGIDEGIILTTGWVTSAPGPNSSGGEWTDNLGDGSVLLDNMTGDVTYDAAEFTFDFVASTTEVTFTYVFASEEYPEFVCSFNDAFGFFVSGTGYTANQNIALVPGTSDFVSIDNVNDNGVGCPPYYPAYYNDNNAGTAVEYDGYTTPITATITTVPCETYQITIAVADVGDSWYDSAVFLQAQSFSAGVNVDVAASASNGTQSSDINCDESGQFLFVNNGDPFTEVTTINFTIGGNAAGGVDYDPITTSVTFQPGESFTTLDISGIIAQLTTTPETLTISLTESCSCSAPPEATLFLCLQIMLPIEVIDFKGRKVGAEVRLDWKTVSEQNSDYFVVLRSSDQQDWEKVGFANAAGNSFETLDYHAFDHEPMLGTNYYRLLMVDKDGNAKFSEIIALDFERSESLSIYPNPSTGLVQIDFVRGSGEKLHIVGVDGALIEEMLIDDEQQRVQMDLSDYPKGVYFVRWISEGLVLENERLILK